MSPSKPATTERRSTASNSTALPYTLSASGATLDYGETVAAQRLSQIFSPDAPRAYEKSASALGLLAATQQRRPDAAPGTVGSGGTPEVYAASGGWSLPLPLFAAFGGRQQWSAVRMHGLVLLVRLEPREPSGPVLRDHVGRVVAEALLQRSCARVIACVLNGTDVPHYVL